MLMRALENAVHATRVAIRFTAAIQRRGGFANEGAAREAVSGAAMQQAYDEACAHVRERFTRPDGSVDAEAAIRAGHRERAKAFSSFLKQLTRLVKFQARA